MLFEMAIMETGGAVVLNTLNATGVGESVIALWKFGHYNCKQVGYNLLVDTGLDVAVRTHY